MENCKDLVQRFWQEEDGMGTVEVVIIIAVLVAVALMFKDGITKFVKNLMDDYFDSGKVGIEPEKYTPPTTGN